MGFFAKKHSVSAPLLIIKKDADDVNVKEYKSIEEAIADLENDPNVPTEKIEKLRSSLKNLKYKTSIKIRNGEILKG
jgi:polyhydroxyalkanoate synthesis regulator phasin